MSAPARASRAKSPKSPAGFQVTIGNTGALIRCAADETVLHAAMRAGIDYPHACASGNCGMCLSQLVAGKVAMLPRADATLSPEQAASGKTLACRAMPCSDLSIRWLGRTGR
ncbi:MAG: 2Fe-2S iron-sulfur cluster-binding protein [Burkholderiaceae bacterium]